MRFFYDHASRFTACVTICLFCLSFSASAQAECPEDAAIALYLAAYAKGIPAAGFGAYPGFDANLLVEVKDAGLADATTPLQALQHLESVITFVELSDAMIPGPLTANELVATNLSFRGGIKGAELPVQATQAFADAVAAFTVTMVDESRDGQVLGTGRGDVLMGHPLNAAILLAKALKLAGISLKTGDVLCLGSLIEPQPPRAGMKIKLQYLGLPGDPELELEFSEAFDRGR